MRRPSIVCRRAVQNVDASALQHIWVSDELLASAFDRYTSRTCPHQKRYGSHVPGPLEARRREVKRRMTAIAYPQGAAPMPPLFSFGALFGRRSNPQTSWRYEPPSPPQQQELSSLHPEIPPSLPQSAPLLDSSTQFFDLAMPAESTVPSDVTQDDSAGVLATLTPHRAHLAEIDCLTSKKQGETWSGARLETSRARIQRLIVSGGQSPEKADDSALFDSIRSNYPDDHDSGSFTVWLVEQCVEARWSPGKLFSYLQKYSPRLPDLRTQEALQLLLALTKISPYGKGKGYNFTSILGRLCADEVKRYKSPKGFDYVNLTPIYRTAWHSILPGGESSLESSKHLGEAILFYIWRTFDNVDFQNDLRRIFHASVSNDISAVFLSLVQDAQDSKYGKTHVATLLNCIPLPLLRAWTPAILDKLLKERDSRLRLAPKELPTFLETWADIIDCFERRFVPETEAGNLSAWTITNLPSTVRPWHIGAFLRRSSPHQLVDYLLHRLPSQTPTSQLPAVYDFMEQHRARTALSYRNKETRVCVFGDLLIQMHRASIPNHIMAEDIFDYVRRYERRGDLIQILKRMKTNGAQLFDTAFLSRFLQGTLMNRDGNFRRSDLAFAFHLLQVARRVEADTAESFVADYAELMHVTQRTDKFSAIVQSAKWAKLLPAVYQEQSLDELRQIDTELVHQLAHQHSIDFTRTSRQAWRATYHLYKYLVENDRPVGPLFTNAMVQTNLVRPLMENHFVSSRRMRWVCHIVARVEGARVARNIEAGFYTWRAELIHFAKRRHVSLGGDPKDRVHVNSMRKLGLL
ncbi:hypothetical protein EJ04DRAFT_516599 [Polyplosphaeria fusca]|uniref:Uncharacterized protein n=1 Tax=Polyplosphaeria fusca TaxID=682080 RepID=A0A9P4QJH3_9PLEO|nr:hypothetical protein EJ04DRAFT_516599 [Polyplosphaeria fusca]